MRNPATKEAQQKEVREERRGGYRHTTHIAFSPKLLLLMYLCGVFLIMGGRNLISRKLGECNKSTKKNI